MICECGHRQEIHGPLCRGARIRLDSAKSDSVTGMPCPCDEFVPAPGPALGSLDELKEAIDASGEIVFQTIEAAMDGLAKWCEHRQLSRYATVERCRAGIDGTWRWRVTLTESGGLVTEALDEKLVLAVHRVLARWDKHTRKSEGAGTVRTEKAMPCSGCGRWCPASRWTTQKTCGLCLEEGRNIVNGQAPNLNRDVQMRQFNDDDSESATGA